MTREIVTRFSPSPSGSIHIGSARTALFNLIYAKHMGGKCILRIEDTDKERSTDDSVAAIFNGFKWLGLEFDGEPVFQASRAERHKEVVKALVASGKAYLCYMTTEETAAWKAANRGKAFRSTWRDGIPKERTLPTISGSYVVRFKGPTTGKTVINDLVKGTVSFDNENLDDLVLLRSDGSPTYNLAVVVDDHDSGVNVIIRGDDHVNNTPRQKLIYEAMGWSVPEFAHIPLIHGEDGKKLSKRHGAASVTDFADKGYLPEAMRNYLTRLGWGHGDSEIFSDDEAAAWFAIKDVVSSPARFDFKKLNHINSHYLINADTHRLVKLVDPYLKEMALYLDAYTRLDELVSLFVEGSPTVEALAKNMTFAITDITYDDKAKAVLSKDGSRDILNMVSKGLAICSNFGAAYLNKLIHDLADAENIPMKVIGPVIRSALTGATVAPDLGTCLAAIGKERSLERLCRGALLSDASHMFKLTFIKPL